MGARVQITYSICLIRPCALSMPRLTKPVAGMARVTAENILSVLDSKPNRDNAINPEVLG